MMPSKDELPDEYRACTFFKATEKFAALGWTGTLGRGRVNEAGYKQKK